MLNCEDPDIFEKYDYKVIPGGCRTTDPDSGEYEDVMCIDCIGGPFRLGGCENFPKAQAMAIEVGLIKPAFLH